MAWRGNTVKPTTNISPNNRSEGEAMSGMKAAFPAAVAGPEHAPTRAHRVRRDKDSENNFSVTLLDVDTTILSYLDTVISPMVVDSGRQVKVPINYASPERWKAIRKDGAIRDKHGKVQCPAIAFRRSTMQRNDNLTTLNRYLQYPVVKKFSKKNNYDRFSVMSGFNPVKEIYSVAMPDHVIVNYDFIIWTELVEQGNSIVEAINFSTEDYWGSKNKYKFRTSISDYNFETTTEAEQDRVVRTTFSMMVYAYLLPDKYENYKSTVQKAFTTRKVVFGVNEGTVNLTGLSDEELKKKTRELFNSTSIPTTVADFNKTSASPHPGIVQQANFANFSGHANTAQTALTASYVNLQYAGGTFQDLTITGGGASGSINTNVIPNVTTSGYIDSIPIERGSTAKWLISINDGVDNFKTGEVVASWNDIYVKYNITEVSEIGSVPVLLSANNSGGNINLLVNPLSGTWTIKLFRMLI
jgi:hypothetical protein